MLFANAGVPMVCVSIPTMLIALFPIAWVESLVYRSVLGLPRKEAFWGACSANVWSTLVGIPLAWVAMFAAQIALGGSRGWGMETEQGRLYAVTVQAAWLVPYQQHLPWMIPAASLVLLLPFYLASVAVEFLVLSNRWRKQKQKLTIGAVMVANSLSYIGLGCYYAVQLWFRFVSD